jgi:hypothetical protein
MHSQLENSLVVGAQRAYESAYRKPHSPAALAGVIAELEVALQQRGARSPLIEHAASWVEDCVLDDMESLTAALWQSQSGDASAVIALMDKHVAAYAAQHLSALIEHFHIAVDEAA